MNVPVREDMIVVIKEIAGQKIEDPYGNIHDIPEKAEIKINSHRPNWVELFEIK